MSIQCITYTQCGHNLAVSAHHLVKFQLSERGETADKFVINNKLRNYVLIPKCECKYDLHTHTHTRDSVMSSMEMHARVHLSGHLPLAASRTMRSGFSIKLCFYYLCNSKLDK